MNINKKVRVEEFARVNREMYSNRNNTNQEQTMGDKLLAINNILSKGYSYNRFLFVADNIGQLNVNNIKSLNNYMMTLHNECSSYLFNSEGFAEHIFDELKTQPLEPDLVRYYGKELKTCIKLLYLHKEREISLDKNTFVSVACLLLYLTRPTYLVNINENWYTMPAKIYIIETVLDLIKNTITNEMEIEKNFYSSVIDEIEESYVEELELDFSSEDDNSFGDDSGFRNDYGSEYSSFSFESNDGFGNNNNGIWGRERKNKERNHNEERFSDVKEKTNKPPQFEDNSRGWDSFSTTKNSENYNVDDQRHIDNKAGGWEGFKPAPDRPEIEKSNDLEDRRILSTEEYKKNDEKHNKNAVKSTKKVTKSEVKNTIKNLGDLFDDDFEGELEPFTENDEEEKKEIKSKGLFYEQSDVEPDKEGFKSIADEFKTDGRFF